MGTSNKANPFRYYLRNDEDVSDEVVEYVEQLGLDAIVAIGGDGTMSIAHGLHEKGVPLVGVPKTIDNDIVGTERTFGFDTAVHIATESIDRLHTTAQSHQRIMILETMGRYAGWIALHSGVASGADVILIPEFEYEIEEVARMCREREQGGQKFTLIVVAEGAKPVGGEMTIHQIDESSPDPIRLGGIAQVLRHQLEGLVRSEVRATVLGHVQRGGTPTAFDRVLASAFGSHAAKVASERRFGVMVALQKNELTEIPLFEVADKTRTVPLGSPALHAARSVGTSFGTAKSQRRISPARFGEPGTINSNSVEILSAFWHLRQLQLARYCLRTRTRGQTTAARGISFAGQIISAVDSSHRRL